IFVTQKSGGKWKDIKNLGKIVNTKDNDGEPFISADGNILIFASTRPGGQGSTDIWMTSRTESGWNKPWNVGTPINSKHEESQPFLTQDGNEVFFMAVNRDNVPGPAVFRSLKGKESWGKPEVIVSGMVGEPTLTADKQYLYFVHLIMKGGKLVDAEIMFTRRLEK
nr:PD40 domain-containing protein [bacterium]